MKKVLPFLLLLVGLGAGYFLFSGGGSSSTETAVKFKEPKKYSVEDAFKVLAEENDLVRTMYTKEIVGIGKKAGLAFHEDWQKDEKEAGPLPALFLRSTSGVIQKSPIPLGLYLGSDKPIRKANKFVGVQADKFSAMRSDPDHKPVFFYDEESKLHTAMFPDFAGAGPCVSCHNDHPETSKSDWVLNDLMGATTWTYPSDSLSTSELLDLVKIYRKGVKETYESYIKEVKGFKENDVPAIVPEWINADKYAVPSTETFMKKVDAITSSTTMEKLMSSL